MNEALAVMYRNTDFSQYFSEIYEVVRTVEVVMNEQTYRVEIVRSGSCSDRHYYSRVWKLEDVVIQLAYPEDQNRPTRKTQLWIRHSQPWIHQTDPDIALRQALHFLSEPMRLG
ncbi:MAG: hypothetical protein GX493_13460 [Firmicutes bacterium]|nr:hypothetical protein [Bacillota bacterium]